MCKFSASSCPSGWNQYNAWSTTQSQSSSYTNEVVSGTCVPGCILLGATVQTCGTSSANCVTSAHAWSNHAVESNTCVGAELQREGWSSVYDYPPLCPFYPPYAPSCGAFAACTGATSVTPTSTITEIGCY